MSKETEASGLRLGELISAFATDLARGQLMEHELRSCLLAVHLEEILGLGEDQLSDVYYMALLRWMGYTGHAQAATFDFGRPLDVLTDIVRFPQAGSPPIRRTRTVVATLASGQEGLEEFFRSGCEGSGAKNSRSAPASFGSPRTRSSSTGSAGWRPRARSPKSGRHHPRPRHRRGGEVGQGGSPRGGARRPSTHLGGTTRDCPASHR